MAGVKHPLHVVAAASLDEQSQPAGSLARRGAGLTWGTCGARRGGPDGYCNGVL